MPSADPAAIPNKPPTYKHGMEGTYAVALIIIAYVVFTRPLIFYNFIPYWARALVEGLPLVLLALAIFKQYRQTIVPMLAWLVLAALNFLLTESDPVLSATSFLKLLFLFVLIALLANMPRLRKVLQLFSGYFWLVVSVSVILAFIGYQLKLVSFLHWDFSEINEKAPYQYFHNLWLGNVRKHFAFDDWIPKAMWYFVEPGPLSLFFAFNFIFGDLLFTGRLRSDLFRYVNFVAGLCTISISYFLFFIIYFSARLFRSMTGRLFPVVFSLIMVVCAAAVISSDAFQAAVGGETKTYTSLLDRVTKLEVARAVVSDNVFQTIVVGNGIELAGKGFDTAITSGVLTHIAERGLVFTILIWTFIYRLIRPQYALFGLIVYYNFSFEFLFYPIFSLFLGMFYVAIRTAEAEGLAPWQSGKANAERHSTARAGLGPASPRGAGTAVVGRAEQ